MRSTDNARSAGRPVAVGWQGHHRAGDGWPDELPSIEQGGAVMSDVWAIVIGALIGALAGPLGTLAVMRKQLASEESARAAAQSESRTQDRQNLKRELLAAFVAGRVAAGEWLKTSRDSPEKGVALAQLLGAAGRLSTAGELLADDIGTKDARKAAAILMERAMRISTFPTGPPIDGQWDDRAASAWNKAVGIQVAPDRSVGEGKSVGVLVEELLATSPD